MKNRLHELRVQRPNGQLEVRDELAFVAAFVLDGNTALVCAKVIHDELPASTEVTGRIRHFGIDRRGIEHEGFHAHLVPDERDRELREVEVFVGHRLQARRAACA